MQGAELNGVGAGGDMAARSLDQVTSEDADQLDVDSVGGSAAAGSFFPVKAADSTEHP